MSTTAIANNRMILMICKNGSDKNNTNHLCPNNVERPALQG